MSDEEKMCFFCNNDISDTESYNIFKTILLPTNLPMYDILGNILGTTITEKTTLSKYLCIACFTLVNELMQIEDRSLNIRNDLLLTYQRNYSDSDSIKKEVLETTVEEGEILNVDADTDNDNESVMYRKKFSEIEAHRVEINSDISHVIVDEDGDYMCKYCDASDESTNRYSIKDINMLVLHLKAHHDVKAFLCDVCGSEFRKQGHMTLHTLKHASEKGEFGCSICGRVFAALSAYRSHKRTHINYNKNYECDKCDRRFGSKNLLEEHSNMHLGVRPYECEKCNKKFTSKYTMKAHLKTHEQRERKYKCETCEKCFLTTANLLQHEKTHLNRRMFSCKLCSKTFISARSLDVHMIVHTGVKAFKCTMCDKAFARKAELRDHVRTHTGERPFKCDICDMAFAQRSNLLSHRRVRHMNDRRHKCTMCDKAFKRRRLLDYHILSSHTNERPFRCDTCDASFVYPEHYKKHMLVHSGAKPYKCEVCDKAFNSRDNRNAHRYIHSDKKPYECIECGAGFMRRPLLATHMSVTGHVNDSIIVNQPNIGIDKVHYVQQEDVEYVIADDGSQKEVVWSEGTHYVVEDDETDGELNQSSIEESEQLIDEDGNIVYEIGDTKALTISTLVNDYGQVITEQGEETQENDNESQNVG